MRSNSQKINQKTKETSKELSQPIIPVILCGGEGSRLWPISRELYPKPFIRLPDGKSLIQKSFILGANLNGVKEIVVVTKIELLQDVIDEWSEVKKEGVSLTLILEPFGRNTAPALAIASLYVLSKYDLNIVLLALPADHIIGSLETFQTTLEKTLKPISQGKIVTLGIKPTRPETAYGYINFDGIKVKKFVEKPSYDKALQFFNSGEYLWNSGIFVFKPDVLIQELEKYSPKILKIASQSLKEALTLDSHGFKQVEIKSSCYIELPDDSLDYAVIEKSDRVSVIPADFEWSDIGSWNSFSDLYPEDENGNRINGETVTHSTSNCVIHSDNRLVATVGIKDLIIVDSPDAILVCSKLHAQEVKNLYKKIKHKSHQSQKAHLKVNRPWGSYSVIQKGKHFKIKKITVKPGAALSMQMHNKRSEHWVVISGQATVINGDNHLTLEVDQSTYIKAGVKHRLINDTTEYCELIEVQTGDYLEEDDIIRFEDEYGRSIKQTA